jgi:hypothetical protein
MDYETAIESFVSRREAIDECARHGIVADYDGIELFDCASGETIAFANQYGEYAGADVLAWLGY